MNFQHELQPHLRAATIIAAAIIVSLIITLGIVEFIRSRFAPFTGFAPQLAGVPALRFVFYGAAVAVVALARALRPVLHGRPSRNDAKASLLNLQRAVVTNLVLSEAPGILGFVLFLLGGYNIDFYILVFVSLFLVFIHFPRRSSWEEELRVQGGVR